MNFDAIPTLGSVRERLGFFACKTEAGELNDTLNNAYKLIADLEDKVSYWQEAYKHCLHVKGSCSCQGRAEKLWCQRCKYITKYEQQTGNKCR